MSLFEIFALWRETPRVRELGQADLGAPVPRSSERVRRRR